MSLLRALYQKRPRRHDGWLPHRYLMLSEFYNTFQMYVYYTMTRPMEGKCHI